VAGLDGGQRLKPLRHVVGGGGVERLDGHEGGQRQADVFRVDERGVALDDAVLLQPAHPLVDRGHREPGLPGKLGEAHPPVAGQQRHDRAVDLLHVATVSPRAAPRGTGGPAASPRPGGADDFITKR
jgi:hypothetical protein